MDKLFSGSPLPDDLFRRAKAAAALRGCKFKELVEEGLIRVLESPDQLERKRKPKTVFDLMEFACGIVDMGVDDLASNPKHMSGFGINGGEERLRTPEAGANSISGGAEEARERNG